MDLQLPFDKERCCPIDTKERTEVHLPDGYDKNECPGAIASDFGPYGCPYYQLVRLKALGKRVPTIQEMKEIAFRRQREFDEASHDLTVEAQQFLEEQS